MNTKLVLDAYLNTFTEPFLHSSTKTQERRRNKAVLRIRSIFSGSGSADLVFKIRIRIRIRVTPKRPDPTGSGSYLEMFLMFSKIKKMLWHFYTKSKHLMRLKIKDKKIILTKLYFRQFYVTRKLSKI